MYSAAAAAKSLQSCLTLCDPIDGCPPGSAVPGILQARIPEWVAISISICSPAKSGFAYFCKMKKFIRVQPHSLIYILSQDCFHATMAKLSNCHKGHMTQSIIYSYHLACHRKSLNNLLTTYTLSFHVLIHKMGIIIMSPHNDKILNMVLFTNHLAASWNIISTHTCWCFTFVLILFLPLSLPPKRLFIF